MLNNSFEKGDFLGSVSIDSCSFVFADARSKLTHELCYRFAFIILFSALINHRILLSRLDLEFRAVVTVE